MLVTQGLLNCVIETENVIRVFSALSEAAGLRDTKDLVVLQKPAESTYDHFFKEFAHTAGKGYWPVGGR